MMLGRLTAAFSESSRHGLLPALVLVAPVLAVLIFRGVTGGSLAEAPGAESQPSPVEASPVAVQRPLTPEQLALRDWIDQQRSQPVRSPLQVGRSVEADDVPESPSAPGVPVFRLTSVIETSTGGLAFIDGSACRMGSPVRGGFVITSIDAALGRATLTHADGREVTLSVRPGPQPGRPD